MKKFKLAKIITGIACAIILYVLTFFEYYDFKFKALIYPLLWISIPFIISLILPKTKSKLKTVFIIVGSIPYFFLTAFFCLRILLCGWTDGGTYYVNKKDKSISIVSRRFGCYGTDEDNVLFKKQKITAHLKWLTEYKEKKIDTNIWQKINSTYYKD